MDCSKGCEGEWVSTDIHLLILNSSTNYYSGEHGSTWPNDAQWVCGVPSHMLPAMCTCRGVGQTSHIMPPLSIQQWWVPGGKRKLNCNDFLNLHKSAQMLNSPQFRWDYMRELQYQLCKLWSLLNWRRYHTANKQIYIYIWLWNLPNAKF